MSANAIRYTSLEPWQNFTNILFHNALCLLRTTFFVYIYNLCGCVKNTRQCSNHMYGSMPYLIYYVEQV